MHSQWPRTEEIKRGVFNYIDVFLDLPMISTEALNNFEDQV